MILRKSPILIWIHEIRMTVPGIQGTAMAIVTEAAMEWNLINVEDLIFQLTL